jgi:flagellar basal-body rod protein FlgB
MGVFMNNESVQELMPINKLYTDNMALIEKALGVRNERQGLIQSNIANMETPGYVSQDFSFEKVMSSVVADGSLSKTNAKHMQLDAVELAGSREFYREKRPVDIDEEMMKLSENQLMYEIAAKLMAKKFEGLKYAIDEAGK